MKAVQILAARSATAATRATNTVRISTRRFSTVTRNVTRTTSQVPLRTNYRSFSTSRAKALTLSPSSSDPEPPNTEDHGSGTQATELSESEYHEIADKYMNSLVLTLEDLADGAKGSGGVEVEYAAGVLTVDHPKQGSYVLNKQPPNKQIWLSSPISGPKRFDWAIPKTGHGMDSKQDQEDATGDVGDDGLLGGGKWTYLRDGSTLSEILKEELGVVVARDEDAEVTMGKEGPASSVAGGPVEG